MDSEHVDQGLELAAGHFDGVLLVLVLDWGWSRGGGDEEGEQDSEELHFDSRVVGKMLLEA